MTAAVERLRALGYEVTWRDLASLAAEGYPLAARDLRARGFAGQLLVTEPPPGFRAVMFLVTRRGRLVYTAGARSLARRVEAILRAPANPLTPVEIERLIRAATVRAESARRAAERGDWATSWYQSGMAGGYTSAPMVASGQWANPLSLEEAARIAPTGEPLAEYIARVAAERGWTFRRAAREVARWERAFARTYGQPLWVGRLPETLRRRRDVHVARARAAEAMARGALPANPARRRRPWPRAVVEPVRAIGEWGRWPFGPVGPGPITAARRLVVRRERPQLWEARRAALAIERALAHLAGVLGPRGGERIPRGVEPWETLLADPGRARRARALRRAYHRLLTRYWGTNPRERLGPRARFRPERLAPPEAFDPRSFRTVVPPGRPDIRITVGCPVGAWDARRRRCRVGMQPQRILRLRGTNPVIYDQVEAIWARKGRGRYAGVPFVHRFRSRVRAVGWPDGRVVLEPAP